MNGMTGRINGLGRAPKGVNDGNGFVFISHIEMYIQVDYCRLKPGILEQIR